MLRVKTLTWRHNQLGHPAMGAEVNLSSLDNSQLVHAELGVSGLEILRAGRVETGV
jgi:hypothetical protein